MCEQIMRLVLDTSKDGELGVDGALDEESLEVQVDVKSFNHHVGAERQWQTREHNPLPRETLSISLDQRHQSCQWVNVRIGPSDWLSAIRTTRAHAIHNLAGPCGPIYPAG